MTSFVEIKGVVHPLGLFLRTQVLLICVGCVDLARPTFRGCEAGCDDVGVILDVGVVGADGPLAAPDTAITPDAAPPIDAARLPEDGPRLDMAGPAFPLTLGLVAHWPFDEGIGTIARDQSPSRSDATVSAGTEWIIGAIGKAVFLNGDSDIINVPSGPAVGLTGAMTISVWYLANSLPGSRVALISRNVKSDSRGYTLGFDFTGTFEFHISVNCQSENDVQTASPAPLGRWVHVVGVFDPGATLAIYVDGVLRSSAVLSTTTQCDNKQPLGIGRRPAPASIPEAFRGGIDEVRIYNRALTAADVMALFALKP
jgi:hypothetical protein